MLSRALATEAKAMMLSRWETEIPLPDVLDFWDDIEDASALKTP